MKRQELQAKKERALQLALAERQKPAPVVHAFTQKVRNLPAAIEAAYNGEKFRGGEQKIQNIVHALNTSLNTKFLKDIFLHFASLKIEFADKIPAVYGRNNPAPIDALAHLAKYCEYAQRPIADWKPNTHNLNRQVASFARHLYANYHIPAFFDSVWYQDVTVHHRWFIHVGLGQNIRTAESLPIPLTKKEAHFVMQSPKDFNVQQAFRYGQILNMGGNEPFVRQIMRTRIAVDFNNNEFWISVFRWFLQNPMLDVAHYAPIVDFVYNQKYVPSRYVDGHMVCAQPNLSMKGRDPDSLLNQVEAWHRQTGKERKHGATCWNPSGIAGLYEENKRTKTTYRIEEILTQKDLIAEGRTMRHCVGSYAGSCTSGRCSIWKFEQITVDGIEKRLKIEVDNRNRTVTQARGKYNALANASDKYWLNEWCKKAGLGVSRYMI
jgi:hypothetical protein